MTDKEKIEIGGIDVGGCIYYISKSVGIQYDCKLGHYCILNPNCNFKQLARKTAECEKYEQALDEIEKELKEDINCESQECGCNDFEECLKCTKVHILDIISKAKDSNDE